MPIRTDPTAPWLPIADVLDQLGVDVTDDAKVASIERTRKAAAALVERARPDLVTRDAAAETGWTFVPSDAAIVDGAVLLTARLFARRSSPAGLASFGEFGPAAVLRFDPDIERLIGVGRYARPGIG